MLAGVDAAREMKGRKEMEAGGERYTELGKTLASDAFLDWVLHGRVFDLGLL